MKFFGDILEEETAWAEKANRERKLFNMIGIGIIIIGTVIAIFLIYKIIKYIQMLSKIEKTKPETAYDYFRDFPDENATPAEAAFLYYFDKQGSFSYNLSKIVSGTMLNLALKKVISFEKAEKDDVLIIINDIVDKNIGKDEVKVYKILEKTYKYVQKKKENINGITMKDIENYAKKHDKEFLKETESIEKIVEKIEEEKGNYDKKQIEKADKRAYITVMYVMFGVIAIFLSWLVVPLILGILCIICAILNNKIVKKMRMLTQKGANEQEKWKALKRYMEEYSLLKEREVPELVLWEKYMVYATAFGIADKVLKQLKITYPQILDEDYMISSGYTYLYMMNTIHLSTKIESGIQSAYSFANYSNYSSRRRFWRRLLRWRPDGRRTVDGRNGRKIIDKNIRKLDASEIKDFGVHMCKIA